MSDSAENKYGDENKHGAGKESVAPADAPAAVEPLALTLSGEARQAVDILAERYGGVGPAEALRRALGLAAFLVEEAARGSVVVIERRDGERHRLVLPE